jgi:hypothetical protein
MPATMWAKVRAASHSGARVSDPVALHALAGDHQHGAPPSLQALTRKPSSTARARSWVMPCRSRRRRCPRVRARSGVAVRFDGVESRLGLAARAGGFGGAMRAAVRSGGAPETAWAFAPRRGWIVARPCPRPSPRRAAAAASRRGILRDEPEHRRVWRTRPPRRPPCASRVEVRAEVALDRAAGVEAGPVGGSREGAGRSGLGVQPETSPMPWKAGSTATARPGGKGYWPRPPAGGRRRAKLKKA